MNDDTLVIQDLEAQCRLGVFEWEQQTPQTVWIDVELAIDAAKAAAHDDVRDAVDYAQLVTAVKALAQARPYRLLETLAEAIASMVVSEFRAPSVRVRVKKRSLPGIGYAAVEVERAALRRRRETPRKARADRRPARLAAPR